MEKKSEIDIHGNALVASMSVMMLLDSLANDSKFVCMILIHQEILGKNKETLVIRTFPN